VPHRAAGRACRAEDGLSTMERDELIVTLRRRGRTQAQIARQLGMTQQGVANALSRIADGRPGRDLRA
jgi:transcriptional regulator